MQASPFILHAFNLGIPRHYPPSIRDIDSSFSSAPLFISLHLFLSLSIHVSYLTLLCLANPPAHGSVLPIAPWMLSISVLASFSLPLRMPFLQESGSHRFYLTRHHQRGTKANKPRFVRPDVEKTVALICALPT